MPSYKSEYHIGEVAAT